MKVDGRFSFTGEGGSVAYTGVNIAICPLQDGIFWKVLTSFYINSRQAKLLNDKSISITGNGHISTSDFVMLQRA